MSYLDDDVQSVLQDEFFSEVASTDNDFVLNLMFVRYFSSKLSSKQIKALYVLKSYGPEFSDLVDHVYSSRKETTDFKKYMKFVEKITLADRIKGSAKLKDVLKASVGSPSTNINMKELTPEKLDQRELR